MKRNPVILALITNRQFRPKIVELKTKKLHRNRKHKSIYNIIKEHINERKSLSDRIHSCESCGLKMDRDHAAAKVILSRGVVVPGQAAGNIGLVSN